MSTTYDEPVTVDQIAAYAGENAESELRALRDDLHTREYATPAVYRAPGMNPRQIVDEDGDPITVMAALVELNTNYVVES